MNNESIIPNWDLSDFYSSISDKQINRDLDEIKKRSEDFEKKYQDKISEITGSDLYSAIKEYEDVSEIMGKLISYAYLNYASDLSNQDYVSFYQNISEKISEYESKFIFFTLGINNLEDDKIANLLKDQDLAKYSPFIRDLRTFKKYQLSEELEKFSLEKNTSSKSAFVRLFDETVNNLKFTYDNKTLNSQEIFDLMGNKDGEVRKKAGKAIGKTFSENSKIFAFITNILAKDKAIDDKWRGFERPISSRNLSNFVEDEIVDVMVSTVKKNYQNISHRYYKAKAKMLGMDHLNYWDRNAPLPNQSQDRMGWETAKNLVLKSYEEFSPKMREIGQVFFDKNWIDAKVKNGKDSGAFSHPTIPSVHPYILMNFQGKVRDVMTLAHELGHGIHQVLAAKQGYLQSSTPLTLAETASVFGEQLTFQNILKNESDDQKKKLIIAGKVEDMINTVIRQIAFLEFERKIHDQRKSGEIPLDQICNFWMEVQKESLGDIFNYDKEYKYFWSYIPHFIHSPFYVYSYAFGDCLVNSLYGIYSSGKIDNFEDKYLEMLSSGGTKHHKELLKPFNLSIANEEFWQSGLDVISSYIDKIE